MLYNLGKNVMLQMIQVFDYGEVISGLKMSIK